MLINYLKKHWGLSMKKYLASCIIVLFISLSLSGTAENLLQQNPESTVVATSIGDASHTVFVEYATTTWCPACPTASEALYTLYQQGEVPFYYVSLVSDMNEVAKQRSRWFSTKVIPSVYIDGGELNYFGNAGTIEDTENAYLELIQESGSKVTNRNIDLTADVTWEGDATLSVTVDITNAGSSFYLGMVRSYVTEIQSRWNDQQGNPYHFGFLDFAVNRPILLRPQATKTITATWNGNEDIGGQTFSDVTPDNLMVITTVSYWLPNLEHGYQDPPTIDQKYLAFTVDTTVGTIPTIL
jgi:thiol-disulfide isomerase/thioredoxin